MTEYLPVSVVARQLRISTRRLRTLLAAGRIAGAYQLSGCPTCAAGRKDHHLPTTACFRSNGPWLIPSDYTLEPRARGPLPNYKRLPPRTCHCGSGKLPGIMRLHSRMRTTWCCGECHNDLRHCRDESDLTD